MQKTGLKTFVFSFIVSLFMILGINGVILRDRSSAKDNLKIPSKNIVLFLKEEARAHPSNPKPSLRKIALTVAPKAKTSPLKKDEPAIASAPAKAPEIIMAAQMDEEISKDLIPIDISISQDDNGPPKKENERPAVKIVQEIKAPAPKKITKETPQVVYQEEKTVFKKPQILKNEANMPLPLIPLDIAQKETAKPMIVAKTEQSQKTTPKPQIKQKTGKEMILAFNQDAIIPKRPVAKAPLKDGKDEIELLIPLEKSAEFKKIAANIVNGAQEGQVALADASVPIRSMGKIPESRQDDTSVQPAKTKKWEQMSGRPNVEENPWVVAKGNKNAKNAMVLKEDYFKNDTKDIKKLMDRGNAEPQDGEIQVAEETVKNLLIPIPEDILNDQNLTPQLVSSNSNSELKKEKEIEAKIEDEEKENRISTSEKLKQNVVNKSSPKQRNEKDGILNSLTSIFSAPTNVQKTAEKATDDGEEEEGFLDGLKKKIAAPRLSGKILPTEIRLSFQPNRAEISGQTLRWIQAFGTKVNEDPNAALEIRIDGTSSMELQQKRLNLLHNILTNKGVEYSKINTVFTQREPNSFIIRTIKITNNNNAGNMNKNKVSAPGNYMQW